MSGFSPNAKLPDLMARSVQPSPGKRLATTAILLVFMGIGGFISWMQFDLWRDLPSFKEVTGVIDNKEIKEEKRRSGGHTRTRTKHKFTVTFTPEGTSAPVTVIENVGEDTFETKSIGDRIPVFHDPSNHQRVVLLERRAGSWLSLLALPLFFVALPLAVLAWTWLR